MLKLFATKGTISVAVALVLEEVGAEYELCLIDLATEDQRSQAYLEINSKVGAHILTIHHQWMRRNSYLSPSRARPAL